MIRTPNKTSNQTSFLQSHLKICSACPGGHLQMHIRDYYYSCFIEKQLCSNMRTIYLRNLAIPTTLKLFHNHVVPFTTQKVEYSSCCSIKYYQQRLYVNIYLLPTTIHDIYNLSFCHGWVTNYRHLSNKKSISISNSRRLHIKEGKSPFYKDWFYIKVSKCNFNITIFMTNTSTF